MASVSIAWTSLFAAAISGFSLYDGGKVTSPPRTPSGWAVCDHSNTPQPKPEARTKMGTDIPETEPETETPTVEVTVEEAPETPAPEEAIEVVEAPEQTV